MSHAILTLHIVWLKSFKESSNTFQAPIDSFDQLTKLEVHKVAFVLAAIRTLKLISLRAALAQNICNQL